MNLARTFINRLGGLMKRKAQDGNEASDASNESATSLPAPNKRRKVNERDEASTSRSPSKVSDRRSLRPNVSQRAERPAARSNSESRSEKEKDKEKDKDKEKEKDKESKVDASSKASRTRNDSRSKKERSASPSNTKPKTATKARSDSKPRNRREKAGSSSRNDAEAKSAETRCALHSECKSQGHANGVSDSHVSIIGCPLFYNRSFDDCRKLVSERERRAASGKVNSDDAKSCDGVGDAETLRKYEEAFEKHRQKHGRLREPHLDGLTSAEDLRLFRDAQQRALMNVDYELAQFARWKAAAAPNSTEKSEATGAGGAHDEPIGFERNPEYRLARIELGRYEIDTWYESPYPRTFSSLPKLFVCEFCLRYFACDVSYERHVDKCDRRHPPGSEIYRKGNTSFFEVDGALHKSYCQNLCLLAKLFLDHKTLFNEVESFWFYVLTEADATGCHMIGYFSKEKQSVMNYNLSCILVLPHCMRKGYGRMMIDFSYALSKAEGKLGSPERPLSDLGLISYRNFWSEAVLSFIQQRDVANGGEPVSSISIRDISSETGIHPNDIVSTLQYIGVLKYWKGQHIILRKKELFDNLRERKDVQLAARSIDPKCLRWTPPAATADSDDDGSRKTNKTK